MDSEKPPMSKENFHLAIENIDSVEEIFRQELIDGHIRWLSDSGALKEFGVLATAAIGALEKGDSSIRIVHDATHGVRVNPEVMPRDRVAYPT
eukprot:7537523-Karenia_brevis.AAC.1